MWGGGGGGGGAKNPILVGYFGIPKNDKPRFTVEGQPLLYGMHVPLKFTVVL